MTHRPAAIGFLICLAVSVVTTTLPASVSIYPTGTNRIATPAGGSAMLWMRNAW